MERTQTIKHKVYPNDYISRDQWRDASIADLTKDDGLASRPWAELRRFEILPNCRLDASTWRIPTSWMPAGNKRAISSVTIVPSRAGIDANCKLAAVRDESIRRAMLALLLPRRYRGGIYAPAYSTWSDQCRQLLTMAAWQMEHSPSDDGSIFNAFTFDNLNNRMFVQKGYRSITRKAFVKTLDILIDAGLRGVISDWPRFYRCADKSAGSPSIERSRLGEQAHSMEQPALNKSNRNFSDTFVTEFVERARWLQDNLADQIIDCWKKDQAIRRKFAKAGKAGKDHDVVVARRKCIQKYDWRDCSGRPLTQLTFLQYSTDHQDPSTAMSWPPDSARGLREMISTLQGFNLGIVALCTGARSSELLAAEDMPLGLQDGRYASTTFKMVDETGGKLRDWPLHAIAVRALHIQHQIAALFRPKRSKALWVPVFEDRVQDVHHGTKQFARAVNLLGLGKHLDDRNAHLHRWRHTVARLIALAVVSAPQVLLDLFGHRDFGMTLQYILSAPRIAEEAIRIAREETYVMAENAITETLMGETSGGASEKLRVNLPKAMRHGKDLFDTSSLRETAEVLTFRGAHFNLVRPGVICTKGRGEFGPCTAGRGAPDPGACRTSCDKRLELAISKKQCEETLLFLRLERLSAVSEGLEMLVENINGQMVSELRRWDDVRKRLTATYNDIRTLWDEEQRCPAKF